MSGVRTVLNCEHALPGWLEPPGTFDRTGLSWDRCDHDPPPLHSHTCGATLIPSMSQGRLWDLLKCWSRNVPELGPRNVGRMRRSPASGMWAESAPECAPESAPHSSPRMWADSAPDSAPESGAHSERVTELSRDSSNPTARSECGQILGTFLRCMVAQTGMWADSGRILVGFWAESAHILTTFQCRTDWRLSGMWAESDHILLECGRNPPQIPKECGQNLRGGDLTGIWAD